MKRQENNTLRSSSFRRDATDPSVHHAVDSTGCMAGVLQLISSKYLTRRKFLTFGKRQTPTFSFSSLQQPSPKSAQRRGGRAKNRGRLVDNTKSKNSSDEANCIEFPRLSRQAPRSPTIPPEIRRSNSLNSAPDCNLRSSAPSVVARLMGLEHAPPQTVRDLAAEKRRKLLGALEKCDGDLQALRKIIESVRCDDVTEIAAAEVATPLANVRKGGRVAEIKKCTEQEQPSPVSVLEDFMESPPRLPPSSTGGWCPAKRTDRDIRHVVIRQATPLEQQRKKPEGKARTEMSSFHENNIHSYIPRSFFQYPRNPQISLYPTASSAAMVEAVNDACRDVETGLRREIATVAVVIQDFLYRDLIQEFIKEFMGCCRSVMYSSFPFEKSKRKLRF